MIKCLALIILLWCVYRCSPQPDGRGFVISNQTEYTVLAGGNVSLICGFHPTGKSTFTWLSPTGIPIKHSSNDGPQQHTIYSVESGPDVVRINISNATAIDAGPWNCTLLSRNSSLYTVLLKIQLTVVAAPSQPLNLMVESVSYSWVSIQWQPPNNLGSREISHYNVTVWQYAYGTTSTSDTRVLIAEISTKGNETRANITGLQPAMTIQILVTGNVVLNDGNFVAIGRTSIPLLINTLIAGTSGQPQERRLNTVAETLAIIAFLGCGILVGIVLVLTLYIAYKRYKEFLKAESLRTGSTHRCELQLPVVDESRPNMSHMSIPDHETIITECESEKDDFELSASLAYGAADTMAISRLRLGSDLGSIEEYDLEYAYNNPIYEGSPEYETIKLKPPKNNYRVA